ncbi:DUF2512 family protein [Aquibacillus rhizosphaerae]|uniref:DUF2512 family protein n=1 Tax=Aquibacillus rhizosphaerae TaxID=3051431 RepID=A0ABT7L596_9BACI|nr:DUF2512 family protein [Aquibacillus sp. LR5S19]MDL4839751.1 DUF2512 family protein [Aquibacillus sp. LR5S19]
MSNLITKLIVCPIGVIIAWFIFPIEFAYFYQPIILGAVLAIVGRMMEKIILRKETMTLALIADFLATAVIVYFVTPFFVGGQVNFWGAVLTALLLGVTEIPQHRALVKGKQEEVVA